VADHPTGQAVAVAVHQTGVVCMRQVGWWWRRCHMHYLKDVYLWMYDDKKSEHNHVHMGVMAVDDFGDLFLIKSFVEN
jgi:hypothetical protein